MVETLGAAQVCSSVNMLQNCCFVAVVRCVTDALVIQCPAAEILIGCKELTQVKNSLPKISAG